MLPNIVHGKTQKTRKNCTWVRQKVRIGLFAHFGRPKAIMRYAFFRVFRAFRGQYFPIGRA
jgi:hypothetical protein